MDSAPASDSFLVKATVQIITLVILLVFALIFLSAFGYKVDSSLMTLLGQVVGTSLGLGVTVWAFYYSSSKGSQAKDALIAAMTPPVSDPPSPQEPKA